VWDLTVSPTFLISTVAEVKAELTPSALLSSILTPSIAVVAVLTAPSTAIDTSEIFAIEAPPAGFVSPLFFTASLAAL
jgi:hypothetical protein